MPYIMALVVAVVGGLVRLAIAACRGLLKWALVREALRGSKPKERPAILLGLAHLQGRKIDVRLPGTHREESDDGTRPSG
jgi:hypothetical protein